MEEETGLEKSWPLIMDDYKSIHFKVYGDTRLWTHCLSIPVAHFAKLTETRRLALNLGIKIHYGFVFCFLFKKCV